ncbi:phosphatidate phosphatase [Fistulifera solaris]|uniref:Phosphatidate phosphatase n=1 Tax=Fistulifera solaris TaxID=1519565 RepID=A0A1Z5KDE7_FISSO|nr:phosphatidate phosphatase [Fistulifera solaris]|eukprot:GAX24324.1 phosphatidate phosphatase [Fistulifera solaris]
MEATIGRDRAVTSWSLQQLSKDQVIELCISLALGFGSFLLHFLPVHERPIPYQLLESGEYVLNLSINEQFDGDTVSNTWLFLLGLILPGLLQLFLVTKCTRFGTLDGIHRTVCSYAVAHALNDLATESMKVFCGYLRPSFYQLCEPDENYEYCLGADADDARKSFPSGHASTSFCGLTLLALFIHQQFGLRSIRKVEQTVIFAGEGSRIARCQTAYSKPPLFYRAISILSLLPIALALFVAASRVHDNKHFPADVTAGSVLGASVAIYVNALWFDNTFDYTFTLDESSSYTRVGSIEG